MNLPTITYQKEAFSHFGELIEKEWLITNGLGSYASSTVLGINTRKYHGLLVAALDPPGNRTVCLSKLDEDVLVGDNVYRLGSTEFHDTIYPEGYKLISQFSINPFPIYNYDLGNVEISKKIFLPKNKNAVALIYKLQNKTIFDSKVRLYPLLTCRYFHDVIDRLKTPMNFAIESNGMQVQTEFHRPQASILCRSTEGEFKEVVNLVDRIHYHDEALRGEANLDDCFQPGYFEVQVPSNSMKEFAVVCAVSQENQEANIILNSVGKTISDIKETYNQEIIQKTELLTSFYSDQPQVPMSDWLNWIILAADSFIVKSVSGRKDIIAGYHWFEPWGRDTFISLSGLMLVTGKYSSARDILRNFSQYCKNGLIPNFVADRTGIPVYNTVDGTLLFVNAVFQYIKYTGDYSFVKDEIWENLKVIVENHKVGTLFGIGLDKDGLLMHGSRLTWMDAAAGGEEMTPRTGKAVEIQAFWYNALQIMELLAIKFEDPSLGEEYAAMAKQTRESFVEKFWNSQKDCLYDVIEAKGVDASLRPNQIFAVSLDFIMLDKNKCQKVVDAVNHELVTPFGLRTLSLDDPKFVGKCFGDRRSRDTAYHNGTIWPWLMGPYVSAFLKVNDHAAQACKQMLENIILPLFSVGIHQGGLGTINEIFDCDPPNEPRGCISQAWSVAEPLRAYVEDILQIKPKNSKELLGI